MGLISSKNRRGQALSELEQQLEAERSSSRFNFKILMLGPGESGKSTIIKQLKLIHDGGDSKMDQELEWYKKERTLYKNAVSNMKSVIKAQEFFPDIKFDEELQAVADRVLATSIKQCSEDIAADVATLWASEPIQSIFKQRASIFWVADAASFYFDHVMDYAKPDYAPTPEDFVMGRIRSTGVLQSDFEVNNIKWSIVDVGGQRSERRKWLSVFDDVRAIVFAVNISGYSSVLFEDREVNRMKEAMELWCDILCKKEFKDTPIFLFFNKRDLFEERLATCPITSLFPEYEGDVKSAKQSIEFIVNKFYSLVPEDRKDNIKFHTVLSSKIKRDVRYSFLEMQECVFKMCEDDIITARGKLRVIQDRIAALEDEKASKKRRKTGDNLDEQLAKEKLQEDLKFKILCLGPGESGKSTVIKQLNLLYGTEKKRPQFDSYTQALFSNVLGCANALVDAAIRFEYELSADSKHYQDEIRANMKPDLSQVVLTPETAAALNKVWQDPSIQKARERSSEFWLLENVGYYFEHAVRFAQPNFVPTEEDVVMARARTTGIFDSIFDETPVTWNVVDVGGQRSERKKWLKIFSGVKGIVFFVNLAGYSTVLFEDEKVNRMHEALRVFEETVNNEIFTETPVFVFFNKMDLFEERILQYPLSSCFPEYKGADCNADAALQYICEQFTMKLPEKKRDAFRESCIYPMSACKQRDVRYAFLGVRETLLSVKSEQEHLRKVIQEMNWFGSDITSRSSNE